MGLSPKFRGGPRRGSPTRPEPAPASPALSEARRTRPIPDRVEPLRGPTQAIRREASSAIAPAAPAPAVAPAPVRSPSEEAVALAYQVFDRYLEEGRQFA